MKTITGICLAIFWVAFTGTLYGQNGTSKLIDSDLSFMQKAAQANLAEIETGKLAQSKSENADVKEFGGKMVQDHGKTLQELQAIAAKKGAPLPSEPDDAHKALAKQLAFFSGKNFDKSYIAHAGVADHKAAKALFEKGAKSKDTDISAFAKKVLPDIEHHLQMAQKMAERA